MPVDFLTEEQKASYGKFSGEPNDMQLARYFHLDQYDLAFIANRRGNHNRLGFALQLTSVRFLGTFISDLEAVPSNVKAFIASQLVLDNISDLENYALRETTKREHTALIRRHYGYHEFTEFPWYFRLSRLLYTRSWLNNERPSLMFDYATSWLIQNKILLPGVTTLMRLISEIRERADKRLWRILSSLPSNEQKIRLESLLQVREDQRTSQFDSCRRSPVTISGAAFKESVDRYKQLRDYNIEGLDLSKVPPVRLKSLARYSSTISTNKVNRMHGSRRIALLVAFVKTFETSSLDDALDIMDLLISDIASTARRLGQKKRLMSLKDLDRSALRLADACALILSNERDNSQLR